MKLQNIIEHHWYQHTNKALCILLLPISILFYAISYVRKYLYLRGFLSSYRLDKPVVVIGNITVGGNGKTPVTNYLYQQLTARGYSVGIILRGYKSDIIVPTIVKSNHNASNVGDEAYNYFMNGCIVAIGASRSQAGQLLIDNYPDIDFILSDDGLQHYELRRDYEICVVDANRWFGNSFLLPNGPLREPINRISLVNHIIVNNLGNNLLQNNLQLYTSKISYSKFNLKNIYNYKLEQSKRVHEFNQDKVFLVCAIGNPQQFFDYANKLGIRSDRNIAFSDHHAYVLSDVDYIGVQIITTSKDYVKLQRFNLSNIWIINVDIELNNNLLLDEIILLKDKYNG